MKIKLISIALILAFWGCSSDKQNQEQSIPDVPVVKVSKVEVMSYSPTLSFTGTVFANREANLGAALPGKVEKILFAEGEKVHKGDLIVELADEMLTQAQVENQALRKDYERVKRLREKESISQIELDHIKAKLEASDAKTEMIRKNTRVYAPFSGTIVERMMEEGEIFFINPGLEPGYSMRSGIVRLMQLDPVKVEFEVNEKDLHLVKPGLEAEVIVDSQMGTTFNATVTSVKPMLSTLTRTATAKIILSNPKGELKPGMFARIDISLPQQESVFVPLSSIGRLQGTGEEFIYIVDDGVAKRRVVTRLYTKNDMVAVAGVEQNQQIITEGKAKVMDGQKVEVSR